MLAFLLSNYFNRLFHVFVTIATINCEGGDNIDESVTMCAQCCELLGWTHCQQYLQNWQLVKYPPSYQPF